MLVFGRGMWICREIVPFWTQKHITVFKFGGLLSGKSTFFQAVVVRWTDVTKLHVHRAFVTERNLCQFQVHMKSRCCCNKTPLMTGKNLDYFLTPLHQGNQHAVFKKTMSCNTYTLDISRNPVRTAYACTLPIGAQVSYSMHAYMCYWQEFICENTLCDFHCSAGKN